MHAGMRAGMHAGTVVYSGRLARITAPNSTLVSLTPPGGNGRLGPAWAGLVRTVGLAGLV